MFLEYVRDIAVLPSKVGFTCPINRSPTSVTTRAKTVKYTVRYTIYTISMKLIQNFT